MTKPKRPRSLEQRLRKQAKVFGSRLGKAAAPSCRRRGASSCPLNQGPESGGGALPDPFVRAPSEGTRRAYSFIDVDDGLVAFAKQKAGGAC
jgi:hypothetical protein